MPLPVGCPGLTTGHRMRGLRSRQAAPSTPHFSTRQGPVPPAAPRGCREAQAWAGRGFAREVALSSSGLPWLCERSGGRMAHAAQRVPRHRAMASIAGASCLSRQDHPREAAGGTGPWRARPRCVSASRHPELPHQLRQLRRLVLQAFGGGGAFFHQGGVLLGHLVQLAHGV